MWLTRVVAGLELNPKSLGMRWSTGQVINPSQFSHKKLEKTFNAHMHSYT